MTPIVVVDHPLLAEAIALFLQQRMSAQVTTATNDPSTLAPPNALVLLEHFLPEDQRGLILARQLQHSRPDLTCVVWSRQPAPLYVWAGMEYKIHGFLDKAMPVSGILYWLDGAIKNRSAWPGYLLDQAREWEQEAASQLRTLTSDQWLLWGRLLHGDSNAELCVHLEWSRRTIERQLEKFYASLGARSRSEAVGVAWKWGLVKEFNATLEWSHVVQQLFPLSSSSVTTS